MWKLSSHHQHHVVFPVSCTNGGYVLPTDTSVFGLAVVVIVFGYLLSIFRMKYDGYPYRLEKRVCVCHVCVLPVCPVALV